MEPLTSKNEIEKHLHALLFKPFTYAKKVQFIKRFVVDEEKERVILVFDITGDKRLAFEDMPAFFKRVWQEMESDDNKLPANVSNQIEPTGMVKVDIANALELSNNTFDKCINALLAELDADLTDPETRSRIEMKTRVTDAVVKIEIAKTARGNTMSKFIKN